VNISLDRDHPIQVVAVGWTITSLIAFLILVPFLNDLSTFGILDWITLPFAFVILMLIQLGLVGIPLYLLKRLSLVLPLTGSIFVLLNTAYLSITGNWSMEPPIGALLMTSPLWSSLFLLLGLLEAGIRKGLENWIGHFGLRELF
jgi:hypothetical protein